MFRLNEAPLPKTKTAPLPRRKKSSSVDASVTNSIGSANNSMSYSEEGGSIISTVHDWRHSRAKQKIIEHLNNESSKIHQMGAAEIYDQFVRRYGYDKKKSIANIKRLLDNFKDKTGPFSNDKKTPAWKTSEAKAVLTKLLSDPESAVHRMSPRDIHKSDKLFSSYPFDRFKQNLSNLKKAIETRNKIIEEEEAAFQLDSKAFPRKQNTSRGYPFWDSHPASTLLKRDIKDGASEKKKPKELWKSRPEYSDFPLEVFRWHVYQDLRDKREGPYWTKKRNDAMALNRSVNNIGDTARGRTFVQGTLS